MKVTLLLWYASWYWMPLFGAVAGDVVAAPDAADKLETTTLSQECSTIDGCGDETTLEQLEELVSIEMSQETCFTLTSAEATDHVQDYGHACINMLDVDDDEFPYTLEIMFRITEPGYWLSDTHTWAGAQGSYPKTDNDEPELQSFPSTTSFLPNYRMRMVKSMLSLQGIPQECCQPGDSEQEQGVLIQLLAHASLSGLDGEKKVVWSSGGSGSFASASLLRIPCVCPNIEEEEEAREEVPWSSGSIANDEPTVSPFECGGALGADGQHCAPGNESPSNVLVENAAGTAVEHRSELLDSVVATSSRKLQIRPPTRRPTRPPTMRPTRRPTRPPTMRPTRRPTRPPTMRPTRRPTRPPTMRPTRRPTIPPTMRPTRTDNNAYPSTYSATYNASDAETHSATNNAPDASTYCTSYNAPDKNSRDWSNKASDKIPRDRSNKGSNEPSDAIAIKGKFDCIAKTTCGPSVRRAWHDTSCADRATFLHAVELLYKLPATNSLRIPNLHDFVRIHQTGNNSQYAHGADDGPFLPWHRWYIWKYEQALQIVSGTCVTLPYWDWIKDSGKEMQATVLKANSFGSSAGINRATFCVTEGLANSNGFWNQSLRTGGCVKRGFATQYANFTSETEIVRLIMNFPSFGRNLSGFSQNLQGRPHAVVHNFVSQDFNSYFAPEDPLFMLHHCNVDRIWALYQDYWQQDRIDKSALSSEEYQAGRGIALDTTLPYYGSGSYPAFMTKPDGRYPTPRDVHHNFGDVVSVTYANDYMGRLLGTTNSSYVTANNASWIQRAAGTVNEILCTRRLQTTEEQVPIEEVNAMLGIPDDVPPWSDIATRVMWNNLTSQGLSVQDVLNTMTYRQCESQSNPVLADPEWIAMSGMSTEYFMCFNSGEPLDCIADVNVVSSGSSLVAEVDPVTILNYGKTTVDFSLAQVWKPGLLNMVAMHYVDADGIERCSTVQSVFTGEFGTFQAQCSDEVAGVMLYVNDATITETAPAGWMTEICASVGVPLVGTVAYSISIPCTLAGAQCPPPVASDLLCDGSASFAVASETFDSKSKGPPSWIFSNKGVKAGVGQVLKPDRGTSKTFQVPADANSLTVTLAIVELDCTKATDVTFYICNEPIILGRFDCSLNDARSFYSGSVYVDIASEADTVDKVTLTIPPSFYESKGRLMLGVRDSVIGLNSVTITADCSNKVPAWEEPEVLAIIDQVSAP